MANVKMLLISDEVLLEAVHEHLRSDPALYASLANSIIHLVRQAVQLPPDARISGHAVNGDGTVSLQILSQTFPYVPDGMPFNQIAELTGAPFVNSVHSNVVNIGVDNIPGTHKNAKGELIKDGTEPKGVE